MTLVDYANEQEISEHEALRRAFAWFHGREPGDGEFAEIFHRYLFTDLVPGFVGLFLRHHRTGRMEA